MASAELLDFASLLAPISDSQPSGVELREDPAHSAAYHQIKDAREAARAAERQLAHALLYGDAHEVTGIGSPDWKTVKRLALDVLAHRSKDLWVAAWLIEALARLHGFAGLRDGFRLTRELVERFWEEIHPRPDEDGYLTTVAQLAGLNGDDSEGALIAPIEAIAITEGSSCGPLTSSDYRQASKPRHGGESGRDGQAPITMDLFQRAVSETSPDFFRQLAEDVDQALDEFDRMSAALDQRCGCDENGYPAAPPASNIRGSLQECRERIRWLARHVLADADEADPAGPDAEAPSAPRAAAPGASVGSREEAFRTLLQVAEFFRQTEPHSPVSYALEQAVRWGKMGLPELMAELIAEESARDDLFRRVGIPKPQSSRDD